MPIQVSGPLGLMALEVPAGEHELVLRFGETPFRLAMDLVSAAGTLGLAGWLAIGAIRRRQGRRRQSEAGDLSIREVKRWSRS